MTHLTALVLSFVGTTLFLPVARLLALRWGAMDAPKALGIHSRPVARTGGVAIYLGWLLAVGVLGWGTGAARGQEGAFLSIVVAGGLIFILGLLDDIRGLTPRARLLAQVVVGLILVGSGVRLDAILPPWLGLLGGLLWLVTLMNAINLLDGMDGLAGGVAAIAGAAFAGLAALQGNVLAVVLALALVGCALAFLRYNVHPARMFMGDGGSLFLGLQLAILGLLLANGQTAPGWWLAPIIVLGVPLVDTFGAVTRRLRGRRSLAAGDRRHAYDLLLDRGLSHLQAVRITWLLSLLAGVGALVVVQQPWGLFSAIAMTGALVLAALAGANWLGLFWPGGDEIAKTEVARRTLRAEG